MVMPSLASPRIVSSTSLTQLGIERGGHLVEQQDLRLQRQRARDRDALLLAAGQLVGVGVVLVRQADALQHCIASRSHSAARPLLDLDRRDRDVAQHVMFWNRLYCWNTIAMRSRSWRRLARLE